MAQAFQPSAFQNSAFEVGYILDLTKGTYTQTGNAATLKHAYVLPITTGAYTDTGNALTFRRTYVCAVTTGAYAHTGGPADDVDVGHKVFGAQGVYSITGNADGGLRYNYAQTTGAFTITGDAASLKVNYVLPLATGSYVRSSVGVALQYTGHTTLDANPGAYSITGRPVVFPLLRSLNVSAGFYPITPGTTDAVRRGLLLPLTKGVYVQTKNAAQFSIEMPADRGQILVTGFPCARNITRNPLLPGSFLFTGYAANFGIGGTSDKGTFAITGRAVGVIARRRTFDLNSTLPITGFDITMLKTSRVPVASASYVIEAHDFRTSLVRKLAIPTASYAINGNTVVIGQVIGIYVERGVFTITPHLQAFKGSRLSFTDGHDSDESGAHSPRTMIVPPVNRIMGLN